MKKGKKGKQRNKSAPKKAHKGRRNAGSTPCPMNRAPLPDLKAVGAVVAGSVGSSLTSALLVNQEISGPDTAALLMTAVGGFGALVTGGNLRVACTGIAAAGAGQLALATLGKKALKGKPKAP